MVNQVRRTRDSRCFLPRLLVRWCAVVALVWVCCAVVGRGALGGEPRDSYREQLTWPTASSANRPWTRWWWLGSAVDRGNLTRLLETYREAGIGGVEITCIYGVRGAEDRNLPYLSNAWLTVVRHAVREANRLEMGVDLPTGSGWRMGGPNVSTEDADALLVLKREPLAGGTSWQQTFSGSRPQALVVYGPDDQIVELTDRVDGGGRVRWPVPPGNWTLWTLAQRPARDAVKRAAPGGEGKSIDPYSRRSVTSYLEHFSNVIDELPSDGVRAQFHDSFEYEGNWCDDFLDEFTRRRGYRLQHHLPALDGIGDTDVVARVKCDYRETISDLVLEDFIEPWVSWSHDHGMLARNQAHGSPGNWLDLYAACDIPETESFGRLGGTDSGPLLFRFASSAAHVAGRPLVSAETATWLDEHFHVTLGQMKQIVDRLLLAGVNHIVYHGTAYSPDDAPWPGWLFYASTQLNPQNPIWHDLPALNCYVTRCQSLLQSAKPDNDVLLYWPIYDTWRDANGLWLQLTVHNAEAWFLGTPFGKAAHQLAERGYAFDYVSDRQLADCRAEDGAIRTSGSSYSLVVIPRARRMPLATLRSLVQLAEGGATVAFLGGLPTGPPGLSHENERPEWRQLVARLGTEPAADGSLQSDRLGDGRVLVSERLADLLQATSVRREDWQTPNDLQCLRLRGPNGHVYFMKNQSADPYDGWITLAVAAESAAILDPWSGRTGMAAIEPAPSGRARLRLQLDPGQSIFVKTFRTRVSGPDWPYVKKSGTEFPIHGPWRLEFVSGGPALPASITTNALESWTKLAGQQGKAFAGTVKYSTTFDRPASASCYRLQLGKVADSARVRLNGRELGTLVTAPFAIEVGGLEPTGNRLEVEVTNVAANRIRDLDRRGVVWRIFRDINFVNIDYRPFDASAWPVRDAGLLGPVMIQPLQCTASAPP